MERKHIVARSYRSPLGGVWVALSEGVVCALGFDEQWPALRARLERRLGGAVTWSTSHAERGPVQEALDRYFAGDLHALDDLPIDPGGTPFQRRVWDALRDIPAGATRSYAEVAVAIGSPRATRAVGAANGQNPISLAIPCHRVIGSNGELVGYAGGMSRKQRLLAHESSHRTG